MLPVTHMLMPERVGEVLLPFSPKTSETLIARIDALEKYLAALSCEFNQKRSFRRSPPRSSQREFESASQGRSNEIRKGGKAEFKEEIKANFSSCLDSLFAGIENNEGHATSNFVKCKDACAATVPTDLEGEAGHHYADGGEQSDDSCLGSLEHGAPFAGVATQQEITSTCGAERWIEIISQNMNDELRDGAKADFKETLQTNLSSFLDGPTAVLGFLEQRESCSADEEHLGKSNSTTTMHMDGEGVMGSDTVYAGATVPERGNAYAATVDTARKAEICHLCINSGDGSEDSCVGLLEHVESCLASADTQIDMDLTCHAERGLEIISQSMNGQLRDGAKPEFKEELQANVSSFLSSQIAIIGNDTRHVGATFPERGDTSALTVVSEREGETMHHCADNDEESEDSFPGFLGRGESCSADEGHFKTSYPTTTVHMHGNAIIGNDAVYAGATFPERGDACATTVETSHHCADNDEGSEDSCVGLPEHGVSWSAGDEPLAKTDPTTSMDVGRVEETHLPSIIYSSWDSPEFWEEFYDARMGCTRYYNTETGELRWTPSKLAADSDPTATMHIGGKLSQTSSMEYLTASYSSEADKQDVGAPCRMMFEHQARAESIGASPTRMNSKYHVFDHENSEASPPEQTNNLLEEREEVRGSNESASHCNFRNGDKHTKTSCVEQGRSHDGEVASLINQENRKANNQPVVACVGDSTTGYAVILQAVLNSQRPWGPDVHWTVENFAHVGSSVMTGNMKGTCVPYKTTVAFQNALLSHPDVVVICFGLDHCRRASSWSEVDFFYDYFALVETFKHSATSPLILLLGPQPLFNTGNAGDSFHKTMRNVLPGIVQALDVALVDCPLGIMHRGPKITEHNDIKKTCTLICTALGFWASTGKPPRPEWYRHGQRNAQAEQSVAHLPGVGSFGEGGSQTMSTSSMATSCFPNTSLHAFFEAALPGRKKEDVATILQKITKIGIDDVHKLDAALFSAPGEMHLNQKLSCNGLPRLGRQTLQALKWHMAPLAYTEVRGRMDSTSSGRAWQKNAVKQASTMESIVTFVASSPNMLHADKMGVYSKTSLQPGCRNGDRQIYRGPGGNGTKYLYYWAPVEAWRIGNDYNSPFAYVYSKCGERSWWPGDASQWFVLDKKVMRNANINVIAGAVVRQPRASYSMTAHVEAKPKDHDIVMGILIRILNFLGELPPEIKTYFETLSLAEHSDWNEVKAQYRNLALQCHPDREHEDNEAAAARFRSLQEAYVGLIAWLTQVRALWFGEH